MASVAPEAPPPPPILGRVAWFPPQDWGVRGAGWVVASPQAEKALEKSARKAPHIARDILDRIEWLAENAEAMKHERLKGTRDFSLHCGQYRIPYLWDRKSKTIIIEIVAKHDEAYRKLKR